ncbi:DUF3883 domain-containing protein [Aliiglaciecola sp. CAU 1673]|uniref:DUF3883 domain-containing protein n=1 Tax=Aliiglaciecola sp. CAU 1673 TaxID=3032595 RepID=UPI0023DA1B9E|nr:DUF3883 domain-containing protein [Aliiglaciecola sp. CAU 1673]MDF2180138.1 DUF3883 domain-containing protein [Aliiglaciecola sp. CAU 1673]
MARPESWSAEEIAATVADYMRMLMLELAGQKYSKTEHRKGLLAKLNNRSDAAVELKHQNISAVLQKLGCFWIPGYKPRNNYQQALADFVENWISQHPEFDQFSMAAVTQPAVLPEVRDFSRLLVEPPKSPKNRVSENPRTYSAVTNTAVKRDYVAREACNALLGLAGEQLVLEFEEYRLTMAGKKNLANKIEHVSQTQGDGLGYDILSFEENGKERFIEVKTTAFAKETPFFASRNEVRFAEAKPEQFYLYRLFEFKKLPKMFSLQGDLKKHCTLDPVSFVCSFR